MRSSSSQEAGLVLHSMPCLIRCSTVPRLKKWSLGTNGEDVSIQKLASNQGTENSFEMILYVDVVEKTLEKEVTSK